MVATIGRFVKLLRTTFDAERLSEALSNPEFHTREIAALVAIALVVFFFVVAGVAFAYTRRQRRSRSEEEAARLALVGSVTSLLVLSISLYAPLVYFNSRNNCLRCHELPIHAVRFESPHAEVPCADCHIERGAIGTLDGYFKMLAKLADVSQNRQPEHRCCVPARNCLACHEDILFGKAVRNRVIVRHREVIDEGVACAECHPPTRALDRLVTPLSVMRACAACHDNRSLPAGCGLCHTPIGPNPRIPFDLTEYPKTSVRGENPLVEEATATSGSPPPASTTTPTR